MAAAGTSPDRMPRALCKPAPRVRRSPSEVQKGLARLLDPAAWRKPSDPTLRAASLRRAAEVMDYLGVAR